MHVMLNDFANSFLFFLLMNNHFKLCTTNHQLSYQYSIESDKPVLQSNYDDPKGHSNFGILHTLIQYAEWAAKEEVLVETLSQKQKLIKAQLDIIQRYLHDYNRISGTTFKILKSSHSFSKQRYRIMGSMSISTYDMLRRYITYRKLLRKFFKETTSKENQNRIQVQLNLETQRTFAEFVGWEDMFMSMNSFVHFIEINGINADRMTKGLRLDTTKGGNLRTSHTVKLGVFSMFHQKLSISIEWLEVTSKNVHKTFPNVDVTKDVVQLFLNVALQQHNRDWQHKSEVNYVRRLSLYKDPVTKYEPTENRVSIGKTLFLRRSDLEQEFNEDAQFMNLCLGKESQTPETQRKLRCYYERKRHPYLFINPVKVEQLSKKPPVLQFYEMVGNRTIEKLKLENRKKLTLSGISGSVGIEEVTEKRTSALTFLGDNDIPDNIFNLAEAVSGLKIRGSSERVQFVEYTYGRFCSHHKDALSDESDITVIRNGNRLATFLYYFDLAKLGGNTPFCQAGVNARSVHGSGVLWYNMWRNGTIRDDMLHGACPVLHGHKIIINHWIRYFGNWETFQCSMNQFE